MQALAKIFETLAAQQSKFAALHEKDAFDDG